MNTRGKSYTDVLPGWERAFAALIVVLLLLLAGFFAVHQANQTGFFNERFGTLEMLLLYVPILLSILNYVTQLITGRRHPARLFEAASALLLAVAALWYLIQFPFDFAHLADALPEGLRFLLAWVTDGLGKLVLVIQLVTGPIATFTALRKYLAGPESESAPSLTRQAS